MDPDRMKAAFAGCTRQLHARPKVDARTQMQALVDAAQPDDAFGTYDGGPMLKALESDIAQILGKPAALFLPTGTMAQQIALRIWCERADCRRVGFHPTCHLYLHEDQAHTHLHGLESVLVGDADRLITAADIEAMPDDLGTLLLELPQREIGGQLPPWDALQAQVAQVRSRGIALHMDGARLWSAAAIYGQTVADVAGLFDSVYVSFYKSLGALAGAGLAGPVDFIDAARRWRHRHGGLVFTPLPFVLSARASLQDHEPRIAAYLERARRVARVLKGIDGVRLHPDPTQDHMFQVHFAHPPEVVEAAAAAVAEDHKVNLVGRLRAAEDGHSFFELFVAENAEEIADEELDQLYRLLMDRLPD